MWSSEQYFAFGCVGVKVLPQVSCLQILAVGWFVEIAGVTVCSVG